MLSSKPTVEYKGLEEKRSWNMLLPERMGQASWTTAAGFFPNSLIICSHLSTALVHGGQPKPSVTPLASVG